MHTVVEPRYNALRYHTGLMLHTVHALGFHHIIVSTFSDGDSSISPARKNPLFLLRLKVPQIL
jgi:hypothetical protein